MNCSMTFCFIIQGFLLHHVLGRDLPAYQSNSGGRRRRKLHEILRSPRPTFFDELTSIPERMGSIDVDYGERHPFDRRRKLEQQVEYDYDVYDYDDIPEHKPLRIKFLTGPIESRRGSSSYVDDYIDVITNDVLPTMASVWSSHLSVIPIEGTIGVSNRDCFGIFGNDIPRFQLVEDADLIVIVSAKDYIVDGDGTKFPFCTGQTLALATSCSLDQFDRPVIGFINFCIYPESRRTSAVSKEQLNSALITENDATSEFEEEQSADGIADTTLVAIHEVGHVLGMNFDLFKYFRNASNGEPLTPRPFTSTDVMCTNGTTQTIPFPSTSTLQQGFTSRDRIYYDVVTPRVQTVVRNHLNCQSLAGARLENQDTGAACAGSHWDERLAFSELMGPIFSGVVDILSPLTLALMEDSGWYKVNYTNAQLSPFGHGLGCDFVNSDCIVNDQVPYYGKGVFCSTPTVLSSDGLVIPDQIVCDPLHIELTYCDLFDSSQVFTSAELSFPSNGIRYFSDPNLASSREQMDYCPLPVLRFGVDCTIFDPYQDPIYSGETYGPGSRCINAAINSYQRAACLPLTCDEATRTLLVNGQTCEYDFQPFSIGTLGYGDGTFECPRLATVCPQFFCPRNCAGRGICDWQATPPRCNCFDANDRSVDCTNSVGTTNQPASGVNTTTQPTSGVNTANQRTSGSVPFSPVHMYMLVLGALVTFLFA